MPARPRLFPTAGEVTPVNQFTFNTTRTLIFGSGTSRTRVRDVVDITGSRILVVTDPGIRRLDLMGPMLGELEASGATVAVFDRVEADPKRETLDAAIAAGRAFGATGVVGFGGGSSLDVAKLSALVLGSEEDLDEAWGVGNAKGPRLPLVLVPTTAGTGSEATPISIITVGGSEKRGVSSAKIIPDLAILDADLTLGLPAATTAATGIDAMVHAIESYSSANANGNPLSRMLAREALRLLGGSIEQAVSDGSNVAARESMLLGSFLAGQSFANSPVAAVHALAYPIGGTFHVAHGLSNSLVLPHVLRFNAPACAETYADLAPEAFPELAVIANPTARCEAFVTAIVELTGKLGIPERLRDVGIPKEAIGQLADDAMIQQRLLVNNPREVTRSDAFDIYAAAW